MLGNHAALYTPRGFNSWRNHLYLDLRSVGAGTDVRCRAYMSRVMIAFHVLMSVGGAWQASAGGWIAVVAQLMLGAAFWSVWIVGGLYLSRREPAELRELVCTLLDAKPVTPLPKSPD